MTMNNEPEALSDDAIWRNDALMALNAKCQLPMSEFGKLVRRIVALTAPAAPEAVGELTYERCGGSPEAHTAAGWCDNQSFSATPLKQEGAEPVAWQWRRKGEPWSLEYTFNTSVFATTPETEVRPLYAQEPAPQGDAEDAARYRWLRDHWVEVHACPAKGRLTGVRILCEDDDGIGECGERLDAAIDSARSGARVDYDAKRITEKGGSPMK